MGKSKKQKEHCFERYLTKVDMFGTPIRLTHKGEEKFKTVYGAVATVVIAIYLVYYSINEFLPVITSEISSF